MDHENLKHWLMNHENLTLTNKPWTWGQGKMTDIVTFQSFHTPNISQHFLKCKMLVSASQRFKWTLALSALFFSSIVSPLIWSFLPCKWSVIDILIL